MSVYWENTVKNNNGLRYKIQLRIQAGVVQQRHVYYPPTPHVKRIRIEEWIRSTQGEIGSHYKKRETGEVGNSCQECGETTQNRVCDPCLGALEDIGETR